MYIRKLKINNLRRLRDVPLSFTLPDGSPRMWTVLIGENGSGKTSILQAIALAAAGGLRVNDLAGSSFAHLVDRRQKDDLKIEAEFEFTPSSCSNHKAHPSIEKSKLGENLKLISEVKLKPKETSIIAKARYGYEDDFPDSDNNPLTIARSKELPHWFVIGYGVQRFLPESGRVPDLARPSVDRMKPLFDSSYPLTSTSFLSYFGQKKKALAYSKILKSAIINTDVLPNDINDLEMRGQGGVSKASDLLERNRFHQKMGKDIVQIPGMALAHGYQSTIAWIADLVGHILLEAESANMNPEEFEGLVLIDEIDLYLHPKWQARLIPALRTTFPKLQFIATTHSPVALAALSPSEIIRVQSDPRTGDVRQVTPDSETGIWDEIDKPQDLYTQPDPRLMTGTELFNEYFGLDRLTLNVHGEEIRNYSALASNPARNEYQQAKMQQLKAILLANNIHDLVEPVPRQDVDD
ncbi:AAA family ATPase [Pseudomonas alcaligenes]|uniref:AAA family ATPase n=1 Tax=Aquipseudomonas alcaligenes TaxID=43263 RepID=UPI00358E5DE0